MKEIWKVYKETNHPKKGKRIWEVSNLGRVKCNGKLYEPRKHTNGYLVFGSNILIHRAVAELFIKNLEHKPQVDHISTIKTDNRCCNLRWVTSRENCNNYLSLKNLSKAMKTQNRCGENNPMYGTHWKSINGKRVYY